MRVPQFFPLLTIASTSVSRFCGKRKTGRLHLSPLFVWSYRIVVWGNSKSRVQWFLCCFSYWTAPYYPIRGLNGLCITPYNLRTHVIKFKWINSLLQIRMASKRRSTRCTTLGKELRRYVNFLISQFPWEVDSNDKSLKPRPNFAISTKRTTMLNISGWFMRPSTVIVCVWGCCWIKIYTSNRRYGPIPLFE